MALQFRPHIMQLSDDIILHIMSFLQARDVFVLGQVCTRLEKIAQDRTLWRRPDFRPYAMSLSDLKRAIPFFTEQTEFLGLAGSLQQSLGTPKWKTENVSSAVFKLLKKYSPRLKTLVLEEHYLDAGKLEFTNYPTSLRQLHIVKCELANIPLKQSYFFNISTIMPDLEVLVLDGCKWFEDHSLMAISKCPKLVQLRARGCVRIGSCAAYIYLAARFGFEHLEIVDLRETMVGDGELLSLQYRQTLTQLYLDGRIHRRNCSHDLDRINDKSMYVLGHSTPKLDVLVLTNTEVTDTTLRHIARHLQWLKLCDVRGTRVTEDGVEQLRSSLPGLRILCDFPRLCDDVEQLDPSWLIDKHFVKVENTPRPNTSSSGPSSGSANNVGAEDQGHAVEIVFVEPGVVRIRRVVEPAQEFPMHPVAVLMRQANAGPVVEQPREEQAREPEAENSNQQPEIPEPQPHSSRDEVQREDDAQ